MTYEPTRIDDLKAALAPQLDHAIAESNIRSGETVAVGVGSRGIDRLAEIVGIVCQWLLGIGARPVIIPAMGSHGGATPQGQREVLAALGITEGSCGAPIQSSLEAISIGQCRAQVPVYFSKDAFDMDHAICINRIKPHTKFKAPIESGLLKMLCVGMGKHRGALTYHQWALEYGFFELLEAMGQAVIGNTNFRFAVGIVENAYDQTLALEVVPAGKIHEREPALLKLAKDHFPAIPFRKLDALIIHKIGKEISGAGMDPNVTGRAFDLKESDFSESLQATRVAILKLSDHSDGNAIGLGNADFITEKVFQTMDYEKTVINALTSTSLHKASIPIRMPSEEKAIQACFTTLGPKPASLVRAVFIQDTLHVADFWASSALREEVEKLPHASVSRDFSLEFDAKGDIIVPDTD